MIPSYFPSIQEAAASTNQQLRNLSSIWRTYIINADTVRLIGEAREHSRASGTSPYIEFRVQDGAFFALLRSPNGSGVVRMLTENAHVLGRKTIESVRVVEGTDPPSMYFVLRKMESAAVARPAISKSRAKRLASRTLESKAKRARPNPPGGESQKAK